jgi:predicted nuclease with RNAse H fold
MLLVGIDAASQLSGCGYAIGHLRSGQIAVEETGFLATKAQPDALCGRLAPRLREERQGLVAIDAPLGWPAEMAAALAPHMAGNPIEVEKELLFSRETDRILKRDVGKKPLEIGADKIARASHTALDVLARLRSISGHAIPLAWDPEFEGVAAIEVYPGGTLKARGLADSGYKQPQQAPVRMAIADPLRPEIPKRTDLIDAPADVFDACLCLLAAKDFLEGATLRPTKPDLAQREGWIWVRTPKR